MLVRFLTFVHVMGAIMWIGGGWVFQLFVERAVKANDVERMRGLVNDGERLGKSYFMPLSIVVLASGVGLVEAASWPRSALFVSGGLVGLLASAAIGGAMIGPTVTKVRAGFDAGPSGTTAVATGLQRLRAIGRADIAITTAVVFLMTTKPGL